MFVHPTRQVVLRLSRRLLAAAALVGIGALATQGGQYSTTDLLRQRQRLAGAQATVHALHVTVDSLRRLRIALERDPFTQETAARELYGMIRGTGELLYRIAPPTDSGRGASDAARSSDR